METPPPTQPDSFVSPGFGKESADTSKQTNKPKFHLNLNKLHSPPTEGPENGNEINASDMNEDNLRMPSFGG